MTGFPLSGVPADCFSCCWYIMYIASVFARSCIVIECSPSLIPGIAPLQAVQAKLSLDALLQMTGAQVRDTMQRLGSSSEECARLSAALSCLKSVSESGEFTAWEPPRSNASHCVHFVFLFFLLRVFFTSFSFSM